MSRAEVYALIDESVTCAVRTYGPDVSATYHAVGAIAAECLGGDTLSLTITSSLGKTVVMLDSDETRRLRAQIDEALRGPGVRQ